MFPRDVRGRVNLHRDAIATAYVSARAFDILRVRNGIARRPGVTEAVRVTHESIISPPSPPVKNDMTADVGYQVCRNVVARTLLSYFARPLLVKARRRGDRYAVRRPRH